jgi:3-dehydroquinate synthetase
MTILDILDSGELKICDKNKFESCIEKEQKDKKHTNGNQTFILIEQISNHNYDLIFIPINNSVYYTVIST